MANYITLVNWSLSRLNEVQLDSTTFATAAGFQGAMKNAVNDALKDIYGEYQQWPFNSTSPTVTLTTGTQEYTLASYTQIDWDSFRLTSTSTSVSPRKLMYMEYDVWLNTRFSTDAVVGTSQYAKPIYVFQYPNNNLGVTPIPDTSVYTVSFNAYIVPGELSAAADTCPVPSRWEHVIVDGAMYYAYVFRDNPEMSGMARQKFDKGIQNMRTELINRPNSFTTRYLH